MNMSELAIGLLLVLAGIGSVYALAPRARRKGWFAKLSFIEPFAAIVLVASLMLGVLFVAAHFATIDNAILWKGGR
jgi:uncharacterized protein YjeT (DUF2065 family)